MSNSATLLEAAHHWTGPALCFYLCGAPDILDRSHTWQHGARSSSCELQGAMTIRLGRLYVTTRGSLHSIQELCTIGSHMTPCSYWHSSGEPHDIRLDQALCHHVQLLKLSWSHTPLGGSACHGPWAPQGPTAVCHVWGAVCHVVCVVAGPHVHPIIPTPTHKHPSSPPDTPHTPHKHLHPPTHTPIAATHTHQKPDTHPHAHPPTHSTSTAPQKPHTYPTKHTPHTTPQTVYMRKILFQAIMQSPL